jgi:hypothetical protein
MQSKVAPCEGRKSIQKFSKMTIFSAILTSKPIAGVKNMSQSKFNLPKHYPNYVKIIPTDPNSSKAFII